MPKTGSHPYAVQKYQEWYGKEKMPKEYTANILDFP